MNSISAPTGAHKFVKNEVITADALNALWDFAQRTRPTGDGATVFSEETPYGTVLRARPPTDTAETTFPWKVTLRKSPGDPNQLQAKVDVGTMLNSLGPNDFVAISGLATTGTDADWFDIEADDQIWIEAYVFGYSIPLAEIMHGEDFDRDAPPWTDGAYVESEDDTDPESAQTILRILIADINPAESGDSSEVEQRLSVNLLAEFNGNGVVSRPAVVAKPSPY
jgi:hypothetical protein